jgi:hypothetical protein
MAWTVLEDKIWERQLAGFTPKQQNTDDDPRLPQYQQCVTNILIRRKPTDLMVPSPLLVFGSPLAFHISHSPPPRRPHTTSPRRTPLARSPVPPGANFAGGERGGGHVGARLSPGGLALSWIGQLHSVSLVPSLSPSLSSQMGTGSYFSCALGVAYSSNQALIVLAMGMVQ